MRQRRLLYSASCKYAIQALIFLARRPEGAVSMNIADECGLSPVFLAAILKSLAKSHILVSAKGSHGGFSLARDLANICLADIVRALDGEDCSSECAMGYSPCPLQPYDAPCAMHGKWKEMKAWIKMYLREATIAELERQSELHAAALDPRKTDNLFGRVATHRRLIHGTLRLRDVIDSKRP